MTRPGTARSPSSGAPEAPGHALEEGRRARSPEGGVGCPERRDDASARGESGCPLTAPPASPVWKTSVVEGMQGGCLWPASVSRYEPERGDGGPLGENTGLLAATLFPIIGAGLGGLSRSGSRPETPGLLHHSQAPEMTRVVWSKRVRLRARDPHLHPTPWPIPVWPRVQRGPGGHKEVWFVSRPGDSSLCRAGRVSGSTGFGMTQSPTLGLRASAALPI